MSLRSEIHTTWHAIEVLREARNAVRLSTAERVYVLDEIREIDARLSRLRAGYARMISITGPVTIRGIVHGAACQRNTLGGGLHIDGQAPWQDW